MKNLDALKSDDAKMNMTPMIDMTFLLVVFFMLTIDLSQKEFVAVELPYARSGIEDDPKMQVEGQNRFIINLLNDGRVKFKGETFNLAAEDPVVADVAIQKLKKALKDYHTERGSAVWEPDGASKVPVLVHADYRAKWKYVQWIMQVGADPQIKIYKVQFSVKRPPGIDDSSAPAPNGGE